MIERLNIEDLEEGKWKSDSRERTSSFVEMEKEKKKNALSSNIGKAFLLLIALVCLALYSLTASALACNLLDKVQNTDHADIAYHGNSNNNSSNRRSNACQINVRPFSYLWKASNTLILVLNAIAAVLLLQSLMLVSKIGGRSKSAWPDAKVPAALFYINEREPCIFHSYDFMLRLTYKTKSLDDLIIRTQLPLSSNPLPACMRHKKTYEMIQTQLKDRQLHDYAFGPTTAYKIPVSLLDSGKLHGGVNSSGNVIADRGILEEEKYAKATAARMRGNP